MEVSQSVSLLRPAGVIPNNGIFRLGAEFFNALMSTTWIWTCVPSDWDRRIPKVSTTSMPLGSFFPVMNPFAELFFGFVQALDLGTNTFR